MAALNPKSVTDLNRGLITPSALSPRIAPEQSVQESFNFDFDQIGSATTRKGTTLLGNTLSGNILGLYQYIDSAGINNALIAVNGSTAYYLSGGTWTSKRTGLTSGKSARFTTFLNFVWMVNGADATAIWDGTSGGSFVTTGNASGAPIGKYIENFRARVWISGNSTYPDRLYYSSLPSAQATPTVTWNTDPVTGTWIDVAPQDGESINALKRHKNSLLVFKTNHIYRVYSVNETEPDPKINVGTYSQESVVEAKDGIYFHHSSGFYKYLDGQVQEISRPIIDFITGIPYSSFSTIAGWLEADGDHISWSVGTVTIGKRLGKQVTFNGVVLRYTISSQVWTARIYPNPFLVSTRYNDGTTLYALVGDNSGNVLQYNTGNSDNGSTIFCSLVHQPMTIDDSLATRKTITKMLFSHDGGMGIKVQWQATEDPTNDFTKTVGEGMLRSKDTLFTGISIKGREFNFRISGAVNDPFIYNGLEVLEGGTELIKTYYG